MGDVAGLYRRFYVKLPALQDGWASARCFTGAHEDKHPSARVHLRSGGFRCFSCGARGGVLDALQLLGVYDRGEARRLAIDYGILDPPKRPHTPPVTQSAVIEAIVRPPPVAELGGRVDYDQVAGGAATVLDRAWVYTDRDSDPVGRVRRLDLADGQKRIWQERPDRDSWAAGLNGAHLPVYRLPEVLEHAAAGRRVLVVEGEKAVDALNRVGLFATTNAGGAGKWRPEHTAALTGATVVAICDSDLPGRLHAAEITSSALTAGIDARMPLDLGELRNDGYDIVDYLTAVAEASRAAGIPDSDLRERLRANLEHQLARQLPATTGALQQFVEHAQFTADPTGKTLLDCGSCGDQRIHRVSHGLAFCPCGHHQPAPA